MNRYSQQQLEDEFVRMIRTNERGIYKVCSIYVSEQSPLEDLYQETVLNLWKGYPKFRNESSCSTWIYRIALNTCISDIRRRNGQPQKVSIALSEEIAFEPDSLGDEIRELYRLIYHLKDMERAIVLLYLEEKSYQEIADITGLTLSNVATKLKRIKLKLKEMSNL